MFSYKIQPRLSSQLPQVRPSLSRRHSQASRLGGVALHYALPNYSRRTISKSSKEGLYTPAPLNQDPEPKSLTESSQNRLQSKGQNLEAAARFPSTTDSRELLLDLPNRKRPLSDMDEAMKSSHHSADKELRSYIPWSYVKPDAPWGFVVYRAVYGKESDEPWRRMLRILRDTVAESYSPDGVREPLEVDPHFECTVMEDEERFAGADSHTIRDAFREWVADDLPPRVLNPADTQGGIDAIRAMLRSSTIGEVYEEPLHPWHVAPPRWGFCILVDDICLRSLDRADGFGPVVKMVNLRFAKGRCESIAEGWEDGETDDPGEDVGWMYTYAHSYEAWYRVLSDPSSWDDEVWYLRPDKEDYPIANDVG